MAEQKEQPGRTQATRRSGRFRPAATCGHAAALGRAEGRGERHGALSLVRFHDGVRRTLTRNRLRCLYMTPRCLPGGGRGGRIQPPAHHLSLSLLLTNPEQSQRNWIVLQLLTASVQKPPNYVL